MALVIEIKVTPRSGKNEWKLDRLGKLKCYLKSPPERGLANKELIKLLAKVMGVTQADIEIIAGAQSRNKILKIQTTLTVEQLLGRLGIEKQQSIF